MLTDDDRNVLESYLERPMIYSQIEELHAVYSRMVEIGEWDDYISHGQYAYRWPSPRELEISAAFITWLFCLNAPDQIPARMKMVAEWIRERGK